MPEVIQTGERPARTKQDVVETMLSDFVSQQKIIYFFRTDGVFTPTVISYVILLPSSKFLSLHLTCDSSLADEGVKVHQTGLIQSISFARRINNVVLKRIIGGRINHAFSVYLFEQNCADRLIQLFKECLSQDITFPLKDARLSTPHQDLYLGIDIEVLYFNKWVPIQIKQSKNNASKHHKLYPGIPILTYQEDHSAEKIVMRILAICRSHKN